MRKKVSEHIQRILNTLPKNPGVYRYYNDEGKILYVGKAKNLKNRVKSYFTGKVFGKTKVLVNKIADIKLIIVPTEQDALLLENNLIKKYRPPYNILLKDDKTYPWICIKKEAFPRVFITRKVIKDGSVYFGPYTSVKMVYTLLKLINGLFKLRTCNYLLDENNIKKEKFKVCLEFHIGNCLGGCEGHELREDYDKKINQIKNILKGNIKQVKDFLIEQMNNFSDKLEFEDAQLMKESLLQIEDYQNKSTVVSNTINNVDVFGLYSDDERYFVNFFKVIDGAIIQSHTAEVKAKLDESKSDILIYYILSLREEFNSNSKDVIIPFELDVQLDGIKFLVPKVGDKKKLIDLSVRNAKFYGLEKKKSDITPQIPNERILSDLKKKLHLQNLPRHIECFDNSNIQGSYPVSACVVFKDGKPSKKDYRHFNIKTVEGPDDFASMEEVIERRYTRMLQEGLDLPNLIIIDGGKGQLSSSVKSLEKLGLSGKIPIVGIAKRLEEIFFPGDQFPIYIDKRSESLKLIQFLRNEAHRFGITHHRNRRSKAMIISELDSIVGIGVKTRTDLLSIYKSVDNIKKAGINEVTELVGHSKAKKIFDFFNSK
ncbi:MAG: excinuclease ABC subunit UvrC [Flavobacteriales bacterium]|nr:excinuclease ABC subunit UvrC [Flavobacteriales bacterium]